MWAVSPMEPATQLCSSSGKNLTSPVLLSLGVTIPSVENQILVAYVPSRPFLVLPFLKPSTTSSTWCPLTLQLSPRKGVPLPLHPDIMNYGKHLCSSLCFSDFIFSWFLLIYGLINIFLLHFVIHFTFFPNVMYQVFNLHCSSKFHDSTYTKKTSSLSCFETASSDFLLSSWNGPYSNSISFFAFASTFSLASVLDYSYGSSTNNVLPHL